MGLIDFGAKNLQDLLVKAPELLEDVPVAFYVFDADGDVAGEQLGFLCRYSKRDNRLGDVGAVDLIFDAVSSLIGNS